jgi:hypothetical protein
MGFMATFKNISVIPWLSVLLVEETGVSIENHRPTASHAQSLSHNVVLKSLIHMFTENSSGRDRMVVGFITTYAIIAYHR